MNKVQMKIEYEKLKKEFSDDDDIYEVIDQGDSIVLRFDDEGTEACVGDDGSLYFQIPTVVDEVKKDFEKRFPFFKDALGEDEDFWIFDRPIGDFNLVRDVLNWLM